MKLKFFAVASALVLLPSLALAQAAGGKGGDEQPAPKPSKADVEKVVKAIEGDKAKVQQYCEMQKLNAQAGEAADKKDDKKAEELGQKAFEIGKKLGDDFVKVIDGLYSIDPDKASADDKALFAVVEPLDKQCGGK